MEIMWQEPSSSYPKEGPQFIKKRNVFLCPDAFNLAVENQRIRGWQDSGARVFLKRSASA